MAFTEEKNQCAYAKSNGNVFPAVLIRHRNWINECRQPQDKQYVEYVGTYHIPDSYVRIALNGSIQTYDQFGR